MDILGAELRTRSAPRETVALEMSKHRGAVDVEASGKLAGALDLEVSSAPKCSPGSSTGRAPAPAIPASISSGSRTTSTGTINRSGTSSGHRHRAAPASGVRRPPRAAVHVLADPPPHRRRAPPARPRRAHPRSVRGLGDRGRLLWPFHRSEPRSEQRMLAHSDAHRIARRERSKISDAQQMPISFEGVAALARSLPDVVEGTWYGAPAFRVGGKSLLVYMRPILTSRSSRSVHLSAMP